MMMMTMMHLLSSLPSPWIIKRCCWEWNYIVYCLVATGWRNHNEWRTYKMTMKIQLCLHNFCPWNEKTEILIIIKIEKASVSFRWHSKCKIQCDSLVKAFINSFQSKTKWKEGNKRSSLLVFIFFFLRSFLIFSLVVFKNT